MVLPAVLVLCVGSTVCTSAQHGYRFANFWFTACSPASHVLQQSVWRTGVTDNSSARLQLCWLNAVGVALKESWLSAQGDACCFTNIFSLAKRFSLSSAWGSCWFG